MPSEFAQSIANRYDLKFNSSQPRDKSGKWTSGGTIGVASTKIGSKWDAVDIHGEMEGNYGDWARSLSSDEKNGLKSYQGTGYSAINRTLRRDTENPPSEKVAQRAKEDIEKIDSAIDKSPGLPKNTVLYRGMSEDPKFSVGDSFVDRGYGSTSLNPEQASGFIRQSNPENCFFQITAPKGTPGAYMDSISSAGEYEFLLPRNTQFSVTGVFSSKMPGAGDKSYTIYQVEVTNIYDDSAFGD